MRLKFRRRTPAPAAQPDTQCHALTRAGKRCRLPVAFTGSPHCVLHLTPPAGPRPA